MPAKKVGAKKSRSYVHPDCDGGRVPLGSIEPLPENPRRNEGAAKQLAVLLDMHRAKNPGHGQRTPVVIWRKTREILKGNTTWKAMRLLGSSDIAISEQSFKNRRDAIDYALSDNKSSEWADWDDDALADLMEERRKLPDEMVAKMTGFEQAEIEGIRDAATGPDAPEEFPEVDENIDVEHRCPKCGYEWSGKVK